MGISIITSITTISDNTGAASATGRDPAVCPSDPSCQ